MAGDSPAAVIVDGVVGTEVAVVRGVAIPVLTRPLLVAGIDPGGLAQAFLVGANGSLFVQPTTAAVTPVARSIVAVTLAALNVNRKGLIVQNDVVSGKLYIKLGSGASTSDFTVELWPRDLFELPFPVYTGIVTAVWNVAGSGQARVTEMT